MRTAAPQPAPQSAGRARRAARRLHGRSACTGGQAPHRVSRPRRAGVVLLEVFRTLGARVVAPVTVSGLAWEHFLQERCCWENPCVCVCVCWGVGEFYPSVQTARSCLLPLAIVAITGRGGWGEEGGDKETPGLKLQLSLSGPVHRFLQPHSSQALWPAVPCLNDKRVLCLLGPM